MIEDDDTLRGLVRTLLADEGYDTDGAASGDAALERIVAAPPDLIVLDLHTPGLSSAEFVRRCRERGARPATPGGTGEEATPRIVVMSGEAEESLGEVTRSLGAQGWLAKPFAVDELVALVERALHQREDHDPEVG